MSDTERCAYCGSRLGGAAVYDGPRCLYCGQRATAESQPLAYYVSAPDLPTAETLARPYADAVRAIGLDAEVQGTGGNCTALVVEPREFVACEWCGGDGCQSCGYVGSPDPRYYVMVTAAEDASVPTTDDDAITVGLYEHGDECEGYAYVTLTDTDPANVAECAARMLWGTLPVACTFCPAMVLIDRDGEKADPATGEQHYCSPVGPSGQAFWR